MREHVIKVVEFSREDILAIVKEALASFKTTERLEVKTEDELLTREQASKLLNVSYTTLFNWNNDKTLIARKLGRKVFYLRQDVMDKLNDAA